MPNGYTAVPNVLPGNVSIGGNLTVNGDVLRVGSVAPYTRIGKFGTSCILGFNYDWTIPASDTANDYSYLVQQEVVKKLQFTRGNSVGAENQHTLQGAIFHDTVSHINTGNTNINTIYSRVIRGNMLGNGTLRLCISLSADVQGAAASNVFIAINGNQLGAFSLFAADNNTSVCLMAYITQPANNFQYCVGMGVGGAGAKGCGTSPTAVDTTVDWTLTVQSKCGANTDQQQYRSCDMEIVAAFAPP